jgi:hypothetical protein
MKRSASTLLFISLFYFGPAQVDQQKLARSIVDEANALYRSEMASWHGGDIFLQIYKKDNIGGYVSYMQKNLAMCVFFSKDKNPKVIGTVIFDSTYKSTSAVADTVERAFTENEKQLYAIRKAAYDLVMSDTAFFKAYQNASLNLVPLIRNNEKKVYIMTGPKRPGFVLLGNDYLISFDNNNKIKSKKRFHRSLIPLAYGLGKEGTVDLGGTHTHSPETGDLITATDICTLMLYQRLAKWKQHTVIGEKYVSTWDCMKNSLSIIPRKEWDAQQKNNQ